MSEFKLGHEQFKLLLYSQLMLSLLHNNYALLGGGLHVHVVYTRSSSSNQLQTPGGFDDVSTYFGS